MFKKTVKFEDFDGKAQEKDFYFHMSKAELLQLAAGGDEFQARIKRIVDAKDGRAILNEFRDLITLAVGVRSEDGQQFVKDTAAQNQLLASPAFDELLMELATDAAASTEFIQQLIPEKLQKEMLKQIQNGGGVTQQVTTDVKPKLAYQLENRKATTEELKDMNRDQLLEAMQWENARLL